MKVALEMAVFCSSQVNLMGSIRTQVAALEADFGKTAHNLFL